MADEATLDLAALSHGKRQELYSQDLRGVTEPLTALTTLSDSIGNHEFEEELFEAYLTHVTFTINVWINYDSAAKKFHYDGRTFDCGKLQLTPSEYRRLRRLDPEQYQISKVKFNIGTAFHSLCEVRLQAVPDRLNVSCVIDGKARALTHDNGHVMNHVNDVLDRILDEHLEYGTHGFQLQDLEQIAALFVRHPTDEEWNRARWPGDRGMWMTDNTDSGLGYCERVGKNRWS